MDRFPNLLIFSISLLMGVTWTTEVLSAIDEKEIRYAIPTDIINILTGVYIFVIFVCKRKVLRSLQKRMKLRCTVFKGEANNDTSSS
jgi:G protein-coupled receptor Mth (Methuselah protein)